MIVNVEEKDVPTYSTPALNVLHHFHDCKVMIFVEGEDDVLFWNVIAEKADLTGFKIVSLGGKNEIKKLITRIIDEDAKIIVACDSDYSQFCKNDPYHPQIVKTYGYSIENTMYCPASLSRFLQKLSRQLSQFDETTRKWLLKFVEDAKILIVFDVANHLYDKGIRVLGDSCSTFLETNNSDNLSTDKITKFVNSIKTKFNGQELKKCEELIGGDGRELRQIIKGHFLTLGVINMIKKRVNSLRRKRLTTLSTEHLYTGTIDSCRACDPKECSELNYMAYNLSIAYKKVLNQ